MMSPDHLESPEMPVIPSHVRQSYIQAITAIQPFDAEEADAITQTMQWLQTSNTLNKPYNMDEHLGVLGIILSSDRRQTFLLEHRKAHLWLPPGGHVDLGLTLQEAAVQEAQEELGILNPVILTDTPVFLTRTLTQGMNAGHVDVTSWFILEGNPNDTYVIQEKEASQSAWMDIRQLLESKELSHLHRGFMKLDKMKLLA